MCPRKLDTIILFLLSVALLALAAMGFVSTLFLSSVISDLTPVNPDQEQTFGAEANPTGDPIGGGTRYRDTITPTDPGITYAVATTDELLTALEHAKPGDIIYLEEIARINLTNTPRTTIPAGVTLASNRGAIRSFGSATYQFMIDTPGNYTIWTRESASSADDPLWISVDGDEPRRGSPEVDQGWQWSDQGSYYLSAGHHALTVQSQAGGPNLDEILIANDPGYIPGAAGKEQPEMTYFRVEAESGILAPPMVVASDPTVSGETYIQVSENHEINDSMVSSGGSIFLGPGSPGYPTALVVEGENVRITGIRLEGPDKTTGGEVKPAIGVYSIYRNLEVDNCELFGWNGAAISLSQTGGVSDMRSGGYIHHNNFHHCQGDGLGYGVMVTYGSVCLVEANYFDYCRHAIAGSGLAGDGYEARYNICGPNWPAPFAHNFDMHGKPDLEGSGTIAGDQILIHHNTFMATGPESSFPIMIQGVPRTGAYIYNNWFNYTQEPPVWQSNGKENLHVRNNQIGFSRDFHEEGPILYL